MTEPKSPRDKLAKSLGQARRFQRLAVRWLFDTVRLSQMFPKEESWKDQSNSEMRELALSIYHDACDEVKRITEMVEERKRLLEEYDERDIRESEGEV